MVLTLLGSQMCYCTSVLIRCHNNPLLHKHESATSTHKWGKKGSVSQWSRRPYFCNLNQCPSSVVKTKTISTLIISLLWLKKNHSISIKEEGRFVNLKMSVFDCTSTQIPMEELSVTDSFLRQEVCVTHFIWMLMRRQWGRPSATLIQIYRGLIHMQAWSRL